MTSVAAAPRLSVVMPVYNALPYLDEAVADILGQSFGDFEFVILDDGSTDGSLDRLREWAERDRRIRLIEGGQRTGPVESSNRVVRESHAPLVARMDADDRARPERLRLQLEALEGNPDAVLAGTLYETLDESGLRVRGPDYGRLVRRSSFAPFAHPTIMFRRDAFERAGGYRAEAARWEDTDLYLRMAALGRILVIARPLAALRQSEVSSRLTAGSTELERAMDRMYRTLAAKPESVDGRLLPDAFHPGAVIRVWNGRRPRILRRLISHGKLRADSASLRMLIWAAWADLSPRSLRMALRGLLAVRNRAARRRLGDRGLVEWRPPQT